MNEIDYEKYLVRKPVFETPSGTKNRQSPSMTYMSSGQVPGVEYYIEFGWIYDIPDPNPHIHEHSHEYDEIVLHYGGDPENPEDLGGEIEFYVEGQPLTFDTTTAVYLPKGAKHGPLIWKKVSKPHVEMAIMLGTGEIDKGWDESISTPKDTIQRSSKDIDYEKYLVRKPVYETPSGFKNRQSPTMTYMSNGQVPGVNRYLEFGWIYGIPEPNPHVLEHSHKYNEIVLHIGGDPENPQDLGGEIEFHVEGQPLTIDVTNALYLPKGTKHGPLIWKKFTKPHIEMAIMLGTGNVNEGWDDSGITDS